MNQQQKPDPDAYYYELDSLNEEGQPLRKSVAERKNRERQEKSVLVYMYNRFKDYVQDIEEEVQREKEKLQPLLIIWFFASLLVDTLIFSRWGFIFTILFDVGVLYLGLKGIREKNPLYIQAFIGILLLNFGARFYVALKRLVGFRANLVPTILDLILLVYEFLILYLIIKVEILMRKADNIQTQIPNASQYEKPIIDDFDLTSAKIASCLIDNERIV